jgi:hypothetical protein
MAVALLGRCRWAPALRYSAGLGSEVAINPDI